MNELTAQAPPRGPKSGGRDGGYRDKDAYGGPADGLDYGAYGGPEYGDDGFDRDRDFPSCVRQVGCRLTRAARRGDDQPGLTLVLRLAERCSSSMHSIERCTWRMGAHSTVRAQAGYIESNELGDSLVGQRVGRSAGRPSRGPRWPSIHIARQDRCVVALQRQDGCALERACGSLAIGDKLANAQLVDERKLLLTSAPPRSCNRTKKLIELVS